MIDIGRNRGCILSKFYIKPQHPRCRFRLFWVVSYRNSTSNHNYSRRHVACGWVVSYRNSTSNHNERGDSIEGRNVVSYRNSTSNHNSYVGSASANYVVSYRNSTSNHNLSIPPYPVERVVSYRNSTSNHNSTSVSSIAKELYLIEILHQTTTSGLILIDKVLLTGCLPL